MSLLESVLTMNENLKIRKRFIRSQLKNILPTNITDDELDDVLSAVVNLYQKRGDIVTEAEIKKHMKLLEAEYQGKEVTLNKPTRGDVKKRKVYVTHPKTGKVTKVNFGSKSMEIKRDDPERRKSFRARHKCDQKNFKNHRHTAGYWSCRYWDTKKVSDLDESRDSSSDLKSFYYKGSQKVNESDFNSMCSTLQDEHPDLDIVKDPEYNIVIGILADEEVALFKYDMSRELLFSDYSTSDIVKNNLSEHFRKNIDISLQLKG